MTGENYQPGEQEAFNQQFELIAQEQAFFDSPDTDTMRKLDVARQNYDESIEVFYPHFCFYALSPNLSLDNETLDEDANNCLQSMKALLSVVTKRGEVTAEQAIIDVSHILAEKLDMLTNLMNYAKNSEDDSDLPTASQYFDVIRDATANGDMEDIEQIVELAGELYDQEFRILLDSAKLFYVREKLS